MKCKVKLFHVESDTKWSVKKDFGYDNKNAGWTKNKLSYEKLMKYDTITFRAEIEILQLFDLKGEKSIINPSSNHNSKYQAPGSYYPHWGVVIEILFVGTTGLSFESRTLPEYVKIADPFPAFPSVMM